MLKASVSALLLSLAAPAWAGIELGDSAPLTNVEVKREISFLKENEKNSLMGQAVQFANFIDQLDLRRAMVMEAEKVGLAKDEETLNQLRIAYETIMVRALRKHQVENLN